MKEEHQKERSTRKTPQISGEKTWKNCAQFEKRIDVKIVRIAIEK
jgi:hypothetical protein